MLPGFAEPRRLGHSVGAALRQRLQGLLLTPESPTVWASLAWRSGVAIGVRGRSRQVAAGRDLRQVRFCVPRAQWARKATREAAGRLRLQASEAGQGPTGSDWIAHQVAHWPCPEAHASPWAAPRRDDERRGADGRTPRIAGVAHDTSGRASWPRRSMSGSQMVTSYAAWAIPAAALSSSRRVRFSHGKSRSRRPKCP
jgi:hypothetical protein